MFYHDRRLQYFTPPEQPDAIYAKKIQELIGGAFGEMTVMMQYLFQGWNCRGTFTPNHKAACKRSACLK